MQLLKSCKLIVNNHEKKHVFARKIDQIKIDKNTIKITKINFDFFVFYFDYDI